jgi:hypothetical protein
MSTIVDLFTTAAQAGIILNAEGNRLVVDAPAGGLTPALRDALVAHKPALLAVLWRLAGMRCNTEPVPRARPDAVGGPGHCFSCGDAHEHPEAYGRCALCWTAVELLYAERAGNAAEVPA